jgi:hypothetical protein
MTDPTPAKPDHRHAVIAVLVFFFVAFAVNVATNSPTGWLLGAIAAAIAWQVFKPRKS